MKTLKPKQIGRFNRGDGAAARDVLGKSKVAGSVPKQWLWHYRRLLQLRERVMQGQQQHVRAIVEQLEPHSMNAADSASDEFDHNIALSSISADQTTLFEIDEAMRRILNGSYGVCEETGAAIPEKRLRAVPWTRFSKEVETKLEKNGVIGTQRLGVLRSIRDTQS